jgi:hypothetical protein
VTPFSLFEIGTIYYLQNNSKKAAKKFNKVKNDYDNYEFRNILLREVALWQDKTEGITYSSFTDNNNYDEVVFSNANTNSNTLNTNSASSSTPNRVSPRFSSI